MQSDKSPSRWSALVLLGIIGGTIAFVASLGGARDAVCNTPAFLGACENLGLRNPERAGQLPERVMERLIDLRAQGQISEATFREQFAALLLAATQQAHGPIPEQLTENFVEAAREVAATGDIAAIRAVASLADPRTAQNGARALREAARTADEWKRIGALLAPSEPANAIAAYEQAYLLAPDDHEIAGALVGLLLLNAGESRAREIMDQMTRSSDRSTAALGLLLDATVNDRIRPERALPKFRRLLAMSASPDLRDYRISAIAGLLPLEEGTRAAQLEQQAREILNGEETQLNRMSLWHTLALHYERTHRIEQARSAFAASLEEARLASNAHMVANITTNFAEFEMRQGNFAEARELLQRSRTQFEVLHRRDGVAASLLLEAQVAARQGNRRQAVALADESLRVEREIGSQERIAAATTAYGNLLIQVGDTNGGCRKWSEAQSIWRRLGTQFEWRVTAHEEGIRRYCR